jgi:hypothetical protein
MILVGGDTDQGGRWEHRPGRFNIIGYKKMPLLMAKAFKII